MKRMMEKGRLEVERMMEEGGKRGKRTKIMRQRGYRKGKRTEKLMDKKKSIKQQN